MKGIIRRIDHLGRIVIPIHYRKNLDLKENDDVDIILDNNQMIIKKHDALKINVSIFSSLCYSLYQIYKGTFIITDNKKIIASYGLKSNVYSQKSLLSDLLINQNINQGMILNQIKIIKNIDEAPSFYVEPFHSRHGVLVGYLIYIYDNNVMENIPLLIHSCSLFISELLKD